MTYTRPVQASDAPIILGIETSNPSASGRRAGSVALARADSSRACGLHVLGARALRPTVRHDDALMGAIERMCREAGVRPARLGCVAVSTGPGGFTGLRIAVATAKLIAEATGAACVGVPSAVIAALARRGLGRVCVALAAKGETAWLTVFEPEWRRGGQGEPSGRLLGAEELRAMHDVAPIDALVGDEHMPASMRAWAAGAGVRIVPAWFSAIRCIEGAIGRAPVDAMELNLVYPREAEAVVRWKQIHGRDAEG